MTGRPVSLAAARAQRICSGSEKVSSISRSTPPSARGVICSLKRAMTSSFPGSRSSPFRRTSGPTDPATKTCSAMAASLTALRARIAPWRFSSATFLSRPIGARRVRLAPKVFVSIIRAPAARYSRCSSSTREGRTRFRCSKFASSPTPLL